MNHKKLLMGLLFVNLFTCRCVADELRIQSFSDNGILVFKSLGGETNYCYRTEWASSPSGPWRSFENASSLMDSVAIGKSVTVTNMVPMFYRVVAFRGTYMVIDLSGGPNAAKYPVHYFNSLCDLPKGINDSFYKTNCLLLRLISKGSFLMGSPTNELGRYDGENQHKVVLSKDFYVGVFEVTQRQWELVMGNRPSAYYNQTCYSMRPVENVSYYDIRENPNNSNDPNVNWPFNTNVNATSFMGKLRSKTGISQFDLPTEAQWEYACRAGTTTALNSGRDLISIDNDPFLSEVGRYWYNGMGNAETGVDTKGGSSIVGSYLPNAWGLYDMHGNVFEWCLDIGDVYEGNDTIDPAGPANATYESRVLRGARGDDYRACSCRSATRWGGPPNARNMIGLTGFRVALPLP